MAATPTVSNQTDALPPWLRHFKKNEFRYCAAFCTITTVVGAIIGASTSPDSNKLKNGTLGGACGYTYGFFLIVIFLCVLERKIRQERAATGQPLPARAVTIYSRL